MKQTTLAAALFLLLLTGCAAPTPAPAVEVTRLVQQTVLVTQIITTTPEPTQTPKIVVVTATGTPTPQYTPTETLAPTITNTPAPTKDPTTAARGPGFYLVGLDVASGVWRNDSTSDRCYWAITSKSGDIESNHFGLGGGTMFVPASGYQVEMGKNCGVWTYLGQ